MPLKSSRSDGRGHWPAGKRRNPDRGNWSRVRLSLRRFIEEHYCRGVISIRAVAADLGVDDRSVRKWLDGTSRPNEATQEAVEQWIADRRAELKASRR